MMRTHTKRNNLQTHNPRTLRNLPRNAHSNQMIRPQRIRRTMLLIRTNRNNRNIILAKISLSLYPTHLMKQYSHATPHPRNGFITSRPNISLQPKPGDKTFESSRSCRRLQHKITPPELHTPQNPIPNTQQTTLTMDIRTTRPKPHQRHRTSSLLPNRSLHQTTPNPKTRITRHLLTRPTQKTPRNSRLNQKSRKTNRT